MFYIDSKQTCIDFNLIFIFITLISYTNHSRLSLIRNKCENLGLKSENYAYFKKRMRQISHSRMCVRKNCPGKPFWGKPQNYWSSQTYLANLVSACNKLQLKILKIWLHIRIPRPRFIFVNLYKISLLSLKDPPFMQKKFFWIKTGYPPPHQGWSGQ